MGDSQPNANSVTNWLRQHAIPLSHLEAGHGFADLQPLAPILRDVKVVGLGESTHGTREFFQVKHRLLEFLVSEMEFTVFALEASHTACEPLNDYVQGGDGDLQALLSGIHYLAWHTEEFAALVEWLRAWNRHEPDDRRVTFLGADVTFNERGRDLVMDYLGRMAPERASEAERIFDVIGQVEPAWPFGIDAEGEAAVRDVLPALDDLLGWLDEQRDDLARRSSVAEVDRMRFYIRLMPQWWRGGAPARTGYLGQSLIHLLERDRPQARAVFWAHNGHVDAGTYPDGTPKAGHYLRQRWGDGYYACALEFGEGVYQYRRIDPDGLAGDLIVGTAASPLPDTFPWYLSRAGVGDAIVNFRGSPAGPNVQAWLAKAQPMHGIGWAYADAAPPSGDYEDVALGSSFDGVVYIERGTSVRPTPAALHHAARRERF